MNPQDIIGQFINEEFNLSGEKFSNQTSLIQNGVLDSLSLLRLITFIEEKFQVRVSDEDVFPENFETVELIAAYVASKG